MARAASIRKMGFYPTPPSQFPYITERLVIRSEPGTFRLIDPCCGEGVILRHLQQHLQSQAKPSQEVISYGIELDMDRSDEPPAPLGRDAVKVAALDDTLVQKIQELEETLRAATMRNIVLVAYDNGTAHPAH
jgi:hypothetical protein